MIETFDSGLLVNWPSFFQSGVINRLSKFGKSFNFGRWENLIYFKNMHIRPHGAVPREIFGHN